jgi:hypothetical protein
MPQHLAANDPNQPAMPGDDLGKRPLIAMPHKPHQQLTVRGDDRISTTNGRFSRRFTSHIFSRTTQRNNSGNSECTWQLLGPLSM